jgi:hypothetical protein
LTLWRGGIAPAFNESNLHIAVNSGGFVDSDADDYRITGVSPAVASGSTTKPYPAFDLEGKSRQARDVGAYALRRD